MSSFRVEITAPAPHWLSCEACLCDDAKGDDTRAEYNVYYGDDLVTRLCKRHLNAMRTALRRDPNGRIDFAGMDPRCSFTCPTCGQGVHGGEESFDRFTKAITERYLDYGEKYRCLVSGNPVGTDTHPLGEGCDCAVCQLVAENLQLRFDLDRPDPSPTWAELDNLDGEFEQLRKDLNELALYTGAHHACLAGDDDCHESQCREVRELLKGHEEPLDDVKTRVLKRRELAAQLTHAWCGDASEPSEDRR